MLATVATVAATTATATASEVAAFTTTASATSTTTASASTRLSGLLLERVVDVDELLGVAATLTLTAALLLALEVVLVAGTNQFLSALPLLVVLAAVVGGSSLLHTKTLELLGSFLGEVISVRLGVVLGLRLGLLDLASIVDSHSLAVFVEGLVGIAVVSSGFLALLVSLSIASLLIGPFAVAGLLAPAMTNLLLVVTADVLDRVEMDCGRVY